MACDKLTIAEDLIRRAIAADESNNAKGGSKGGNPYYRKLLGDVLAQQQQAAAAVDEYKRVIATDTGMNDELDGGTLEIKIAAAERCIILLGALGRVEESSSVKEILMTMREAIPQQR